VILRHAELPAYRCFLPDLAGFTEFGCTGPGPLIRDLWRGTHPKQQGWRPSSTHGVDHHGLVRNRPVLGLASKEPSASVHDTMAERVGFEPTVELPRHVLSRHAESSTLAPLRSDLSVGTHLSTVTEKEAMGEALKG
jgi:hypothetical protein